MLIPRQQQFLLFLLNIKSAFGRRTKILLSVCGCAEANPSFQLFLTILENMSPSPSSLSHRWTGNSSGSNGRGAKDERRRTGECVAAQFSVRGAGRGISANSALEEGVRHATTSPSSGRKGPRLSPGTIRARDRLRGRRGRRRGPRPRPSVGLNVGNVHAAHTRGCRWEERHAPAAAVAATLHGACTHGCCGGRKGRGDDALHYLNTLQGWTTAPRAPQPRGARTRPLLPPRHALPSSSPPTRSGNR